MSRLRLALVGTGAFFAALATAATADSLPLHVTLGLWDITNAVKMSGMESMMGMDPATMAQMPAANRARMQAAMAAMNGVHTSTVKTCVTQKDLDHPFKPDMDQPGTTCKYDVQKASMTDEYVHVTCTGKRNMEGTFHVMAPTPATMRGHMDMTFSEGGHVMHMSDDIQGHWLGANCGSVR